MQLMVLLKSVGACYVKALLIKGADIGAFNSAYKPFKKPLNIK